MRETISKAVDKQRHYFNNHNTLSYNFRIEQLKRFKTMIKTYEQRIIEALEADLDKHEFEAYATEISIVYDEINHTIKHLKGWMRPKKVRTNLVNFGASSRIIKQPKGVSLIMSPWNYPFMLTMDPVVGSMAAGNCTVIKPSSYSKHTSMVIEEMVSEYFNPEYMTVFQGNREINQMLLDQRFDHIFFTGSVAVGKIVMEAAAKHLTPVTLELGGKNPCIVDQDVDITKTARRIVWGKANNAGQTCVAPDYILVDETIKDDLVKALIQAKKDFFGDNMLESDSFGKIIRQRSYDHLLSMLEGQTILDGGQSDSARHKLELTLLDNPPLDSKVMTDEIFGPILPIIPVKTMEEAEDIIARYEKPLSMYIFSRNKTLVKKVTETMAYGGGCVNDVVMHVANAHLPFGGFGHSGMGGYHSHHSFDTFSHQKSVMKQQFLFDLPVRYAPYGDKIKLVRKIIK